MLVTLTALYTLAEGCADNQARLVQGGNAAFLVELLDRHSGSQDLMSIGPDLLFALLYDERSGGTRLDHHARLREAGACELVVRLLAEYSNVPLVYGPALRAMAGLLLSKDNQDRLGGQEGCTVVCQVRISTGPATPQTIRASVMRRQDTDCGPLGWLVSCGGGAGDGALPGGRHQPRGGGRLLPGGGGAGQQPPPAPASAEGAAGLRDGVRLPQKVSCRRCPS